MTSFHYSGVEEGTDLIYSKKRCLLLSSQPHPMILSHFTASHQIPWAGGPYCAVKELVLGISDHAAEGQRKAQGNRFLFAVIRPHRGAEPLWQTSNRAPPWIRSCQPGQESHLHCSFVMQAITWCNIRYEIQNGNVLTLFKCRDKSNENKRVVHNRARC